MVRSPATKLLAVAGVVRFAMVATVAGAGNTTPGPGIHNGVITGCVEPPTKGNRSTSGDLNFLACSKGARSQMYRIAFSARAQASFVALAAAAALALSPSTARAAVTCDRYAAPTGSNANAGRVAAPFRSAQRLAASLAGGGTGCLAGGTYVGNVIVTAGGSAARPLVLTTTPGSSPATLKAIIEIRDTANHVTLDRLRLDGRNPPTANATQVMIFGDYVTLSNSEVFNGGQRICVGTGDSRGLYGVARYPVIVRNRIHDCGNRLTGSPSYPSGHGLYLQADRHARIAHNYIYDLNFGGTTGGRGIQLWPDSQNAVIEHNVVDNANQWSIIISGGGGNATGVTRGTKVRNNIFSNPVEHNVTSAWWGTDPQAGIEVTDNCVFNAPGGNFAFTSWLGKFSYLEARNVSSDPQYVDRAGKDFRLRTGSPCTGKGPTRVRGTRRSQSDGHARGR
jgi:hypothetical protein